MTLSASKIENADTDVEHIFTYGVICRPVFHFLPPTIPWPGVPEKPDDVLLFATLSFPSALPKTFRSSNNRYEGMKGFCPAAGAGLLGPGIVGKPPWLSDPVAPLAGNGLYCCNGVAPCAGI